MKLLNEVNEGVLTAGEAAGLLGISLRSAPQTPEEITTWLEHTVAGWNEDPPPSPGAANARSDGTAYDNGGSAARMASDHQ